MDFGRVVAVIILVGSLLASQDSHAESVELHRHLAQAGDKNSTTNSNCASKISAANTTGSAPNSTICSNLTTAKLTANSNDGNLTNSTGPSVGSPTTNSTGNSTTYSTQDSTNKPIGTSPLPDPDPESANATNICSKVSTKCYNPEINFTACLTRASKGRELLLIAVNAGNHSLNFSATDLQTNLTYNITILKYQLKQTNITADNRVYASVLLKFGDWNCTTNYTRPPARSGTFDFPSYRIKNPANLGFFLIAVILLVGGIWACCKLGKDERHTDGVPYKELELGQPGSQSTTNVEAAVGWDQGWDDEWDEDKAVKPPAGRPNRVGNGIAAKSSQRAGSKSRKD